MLMPPAPVVESRPRPAAGRPIKCTSRTCPSRWRCLAWHRPADGRRCEDRDAGRGEADRCGLFQEVRA